MSTSRRNRRGESRFGAWLRGTAPLALCALLAACGGGEGSAGAADADSAESARGATRQAAWHARTDEGATGMEAVSFGTAGDTIRVRPGPRAIYWRDGDRVAPPYTVSADFRLLSVPPGPEGYGLFVGGRDLTSPEQDYLYFLVRHDGSYLLKHRAGAETHTLVGWTESSAVRSAESAGGPPANRLSIRATPERMVFSVNGQAVDSLPVARTMVRAEGIAGIRANHRLDLAITGYEVAGTAGSDSMSGGG